MLLAAAGGMIGTGQVMARKEADEMPDHSDGNHRPRSRGGPEMIAPTSRVNVAFPFSRIFANEPSKDLADLAQVVAELVVLTEELAPSEAAAQLRDRAERLALRLRERLPT